MAQGRGVADQGLHDRRSGSSETQRRLAAILAADVAGYSRLMGADEEGTLNRLKAHRRELVDPKIAEHHGRIVKTTGDGMLVEFPSVVDAVRCAVEVQRAMLDRNAAEPEGKRITFRVGVNLGDVIVEDGDIFGDGVNVAARLEALAEPGGVCISRTVRDQIRCQLVLNRVDEAIDLFIKGRTANPRDWFCSFGLAGALALKGDFNGAKTVIAESLKLRPEVNSLAQRYTWLPWTSKANNPRFWAMQDKTLDEGLRRIWFPEK